MSHSEPASETSSESGSRFLGGALDPEELRRRNLIAMGMDLLLLVTVGFFAILAGYGLWPAVIAAVPLLTMLYFGLRSSPAFFLAELLAMVLAVAGSYTGIIPL